MDLPNKLPKLSQSILRILNHTVIRLLCGSGGAECLDLAKIQRFELRSDANVVLIWFVQIGIRASQFGQT